MIAPSPRRPVAHDRLEQHPPWEHYALAQSNVHAANHPLPTENGDGEIQRWAQAGEDVRPALLELRNELDGLPHALMIGGHVGRRIWPGLHRTSRASEEIPATRASGSSQPDCPRPGTRSASSA
ncbi:RNaseH domain-containing protein [Streptomyces huasconensis]|uniref:RNaseH domain-containing protein n=1 Tax=Streptomyces huasconensis TaxID=1854574 RepID=A0ABV3M1W0_9ACTN